MNENLVNFKTEIDSLTKYSEKQILSGILTSKGEDCVVLIGEVLDEDLVKTHAKQNEQQSYLKIYDDLTCVRVSLDGKETSVGKAKFVQDGSKIPKELILTEQLSIYLYE
jgi:hypothetical protein